MFQICFRSHVSNFDGMRECHCNYAIVFGEAALDWYIAGATYVSDQLGPPMFQIIVPTVFRIVFQTRVANGVAIFDLVGLS